MRVDQIGHARANFGDVLLMREVQGFQLRGIKGLTVAPQLADTPVLTYANDSTGTSSATPLAASPESH